MFVEDISVRSMLHALIIRSPVSKGSFMGIQCPKLSHSYTLITADQIPGINCLEDFPVPILAKDSLSYPGEAVALLVGPDLNKLEEYRSQCLVRVMETPPQTPEQNYYQKIDFNPHNLETLPPVSSNQSLSDAEHKSRSGKGVLIGTYTTGIQEHWYSEPHGALAHFTGDKLTVHTATQWPYHVKRSVSRVLEIADTLVEIQPGSLGVHLDGKLWYPSLISCQAALGAYITRKPVKLMLSRDEDFRYSPKRNRSEIKISSSLGDRGDLWRTEIQTMADLGSYGVFDREIINQTCLGSIGIYQQEKIKLEGWALKSSIPPQGPMEGFGISQGFFASERQVSRLADSLHEDPAEWRKRNCLVKNNTLAIGIPLKDHIPIVELIDSVASMSDYYRKWASYELLRNKGRQDNTEMQYESLRGIGIATAFQGSGMLFPGTDKGVYSVELTLTKEGTLNIKSSLQNQGEENSGIWRNLANTILGVDEKQIHISYTAQGLDSGPDCHSRNISTVTRLLERCCEAVRKQRFRDPLPITVRRTQKPDKMIPWNEEKNGIADSSAFNHPSWGAAVVEIEIDPVSLKPKVRGIWLVADGGKILSQTRARRSLKNGAIRALNWSCKEPLNYYEGKISQDIMLTFDLPAPEEVPPINIDFLWNDNALPKGIGELPCSCIPAAFVQAVSQAIDHPFEKIPLNEKDIWEAIKLKKAGNDS